MLSANLSAIFYLISGGIIYLSFKRAFLHLKHPDKETFFGILGMIIAITVTFLSIGNFSTGFVIVFNISFNRWINWCFYCL